MKIGFLPQEPQLDPEKTVREAVEEGWAKRLTPRSASTRSTRPTPISTRLRQARREQAKLEAIVNAAHSDSADLQMDVAADACACRVGREDRTLSAARNAACAVPAAALQADVLLLDEPQSLDAESVEWLEQFLRRFPGTVVA